MSMLDERARSLPSPTSLRRFDNRELRASLGEGVTLRAEGIQGSVGVDKVLTPMARRARFHEGLHDLWRSGRSLKERMDRPADGRMPALGTVGIGIRHGGQDFFRHGALSGARLQAQAGFVIPRSHPEGVPIVGIEPRRLRTEVESTVSCWRSPRSGQLQTPSATVASIRRTTILAVTGGKSTRRVGHADFARLRCDCRGLGEGRHSVH